MEARGYVLRNGDLWGRRERQRVVSGEEKTWQGGREIEDKTYDGEHGYLKCVGITLPTIFEQELVAVRFAGGEET